MNRLVKMLSRWVYNMELRGEIWVGGRDLEHQCIGFVIKAMAG